MRFLLGVIFGVLLTVATVFIIDSTTGGGAGAEPRIVNWDVAGDRLHKFTESFRAGFNQLTR
jgi:hypothetical protein